MRLIKEAKCRNSIKCRHVCYYFHNLVLEYKNKLHLQNFVYENWYIIKRFANVRKYGTYKVQFKIETDRVPVNMSAVGARAPKGFRKLYSVKMQ